MTAYTTYLGGKTVASFAGMNHVAFPDRTVYVAEFDASQRNLAAADTVVIGTIPKGAYVYNAFVEVLAIDGSGTVDVGDEDDADGWVDGQSVATLGTVAIGAGTLAGGKLYTAAQSLILTAPSGVTLDTLKLRVYLDMLQLGVDITS